MQQTHCHATVPVTLLWKCYKLTVTQQALLRYYGNAIKDLTCHSMVRLHNAFAMYDNHHLFIGEHSDPFIHFFFCQVKMASDGSRKSFPAEEVLAKICADLLSDGPSDVLSESGDDDDNVELL
jgi:hypothetical protein